MDKNIRVNFFQTANVNAANATFFDAITQCAGRPDAAQYIELFQGVRVRIERVTQDGQYLIGELVRQQVENLPAIARGTGPLEPNNTPLGHRAAFRYLPEINILALEANRTSVSAARFNSFLRQRIPGHAGFFFDPCLTADALAQLRDGTPRKMQMRVALPNDLRLIEGGPASIETSLENLRDIVDGQVITVEVGLNRGEKGRSLSIDGILSVFRWGSQNRGQVKKLTVQTEEQALPIDLFGQQVVEIGVVDLDNENVDRSYEARRDFIDIAFANRLNELQSIYGPGGE